MCAAGRAGGGAQRRPHRALDARPHGHGRPLASAHGCRPRCTQSGSNPAKNWWASSPGRAVSSRCPRRGQLAARWGRSGVVPAGRTPGGGAAREGGRGPVLVPRSRCAPRQNWWRLSEPTFLRGPPCSKLGGGRPGAAAGGRRGAGSLSGSCPKVVFTSKTQRTRFQMARDSGPLQERSPPKHACQ